MVISLGCDPCADCGEPLIYDPTVKVIFINRDSALSVNDSINKVNDSVAINNKLKATYTDSISVLSDSLVVLDTLIANGESTYESLRNTLNNRMDSLDIVNDSLTSWNKQLNSLKTELNSIVSTINNGWVQLQGVTLIQNGAEVIFEDSMRSFNLPLLLSPSSESAATNFELTIDGNKYLLGFDYINYETIDDARRVFVEVANIDTTMHSFDSLTINCRTSECISDETTVTAYF